MILKQLNDGQNDPAPGGDTGAVSLAKRLRSAAEGQLVYAVGQAIAALIERVRQQMRMPRNFAMDLLHARRNERIHEADEKAFTRRSGFRALDGFGSG